jgi:predicted RecB family nuclease
MASNIWGYLFRDEEGQPVYQSEWGLTRTDEKRAFQSFVDFVMVRWESFPNLHIYHYAPYEPSAMKRCSP